MLISKNKKNAFLMILIKKQVIFLILRSKRTLKKGRLIEFFPFQKYFF